MGLGPYPEIGLADAREKARDGRRLIKRDRKDPIAERARAQIKTFKRAAEAFLERLSGPGAPHHPRRLQRARPPILEEELEGRPAGDVNPIAGTDLRRERLNDVQAERALARRSGAPGQAPAAVADRQPDVPVPAAHATRSGSRLPAPAGKACWKAFARSSPMMRPSGTAVSRQRVMSSTSTSSAMPSRP